LPEGLQQGDITFVWRSLTLWKLKLLMIF